MKSPAAASSAAVVRRLALQQAPVAIVVQHARPLLITDQDALVDALGLLHGRAWSCLPLAYRRRLLKALVAGGELPPDEEVHEALLDALLRPAADEEAGWSVRAYDVDGGLSPALRLRVADEIGGGNETGGRVWPAALGLGAYLLALEEHSRSLLRGRRVALELGAGPGLPGLLLARMGESIERVVLTDALPATLDNLRRNVAQLEPPHAARCHVAALDWHQPVATTARSHGQLSEHGVDLILAADVVYDPELVEPLLATILALLQPAPPPPPQAGGGEEVASRPRPIALLAVERRGAAWHAFESRLASAVSCGSVRVRDASEGVRKALRDPACPFWCAEEAVDRIVLLELEAGEAQVREPPPQPPPWQVNASVVVRRPSSVRLRIALARA